jgi:hypothetical protein
MLSSLGDHLYILGGFDGYDCLREVERIDISNELPKTECLRNLSHPIKNGVSYASLKDG